MTSASCDADVAELARPGTTPAPAKTFTLRQLLPASPGPANGSHQRCLYRAISWASGNIWAGAGRPARLRAGLPCETAGRMHDEGGSAGARESPPPAGPGPMNSLAAPGVAVASLLPRRAPGTSAERQRGGRAAAAAQNLTHMSLEADTRVIAWLPGRLTLTLMSYSTPGNRPDAHRRRGRMLRYRTHGGPIGR